MLEWHDIRCRQTNRLIQLVLETCTTHPYADICLQYRITKRGKVINRTRRWHCPRLVMCYSVIGPIRQVMIPLFFNYSYPYLFLNTALALATLRLFYTSSQPQTHQVDNSITTPNGQSYLLPLIDRSSLAPPPAKDNKLGVGSVRTKLRSRTRIFEGHCSLDSFNFRE